MKRDLYDSYYINFASSVPRNVLEEFAATTISTNTASSVAQVYDQYLNFVCTDANVFSLHQPRAFVTLNDHTAAESAITATIDTIATSLFSVLVTMGNYNFLRLERFLSVAKCGFVGVVPIIKCPRGNAAEMVAGKLDGKLRDHVMNSRNNLFSESNSASVQRPGRSHWALNEQAPAIINVFCSLDFARSEPGSCTYAQPFMDIPGIGS
jgi:hypothetical protein